MLMTQKQEKFLYNLSFDTLSLKEKIQYAQTGKTIIDEYIPPSYSQDDLEVEKSNAYHEGFTAALAGIEARSNELLVILGAELQKIYEFENQVLDHLVDKSILLSQEMTKKFITSKSNQEIFAAEIEDFVKNSLSQVIEKPVIQIKMNTEIEEKIAQKLRTLFENHKFKGELEIKGDEKLSFGDVEINWITGGIEKNQQQMWESLAQLQNTNHTKIEKPIENAVSEDPNHLKTALNESGEKHESG